jgi:hypothetical protein
MCFPRDGRYLPFILGLLNSCVTNELLKIFSPTLDYNEGPLGKLPVCDISRNITEDVSHLILEAIEMAKTDESCDETSYCFQEHPLVQRRHLSHIIQDTFTIWGTHCQSEVKRMKEIEEENNRLLIDAYGLQDELSPEVPEDQITLYRPDQEEDIKRLISYAVGCMMGRYSLDKPGLIYAHSGNQGFDSSRYQTFPADDDGIIPITDDDWFPDDAANRVEAFIATAWPKEYLEENLKFIAESLGPNRNEQPRETIRRYLATGFFKHHLSMYKRRPIYWLFSSGKQRAFQCLIYLHRYNEGTLSRMRTEYVIPLQGKIASRIGQLEDDINAATSSSHRKRLEKERDKLLKQQAELQTFDEKLRHYADRRISLDLDDGVKVNYAKFGDLLAEVKAVTGRTDGP